MFKILLFPDYIYRTKINMIRDQCNHITNNKTDYKLNYVPICWGHVITKKNKNEQSKMTTKKKKNNQTNKNTQMEQKKNTSTNKHTLCVIEMYEVSYK